MNGTMSKKPNRPRQPAQTSTDVAEESTVWKLFTKIDVALKDPFDAYMESLEYPTDQARVIEKAFKEFLEKRGFWPPKPKK